MIFKILLGRSGSLQKSLTKSTDEDDATKFLAKDSNLRLEIEVGNTDSIWY